MEFASAYSKKARVQTVNKGKSMTKQSFKDEVNINKIIKKYNKTQILQMAENFEGQYGEFDSKDFADAMNVVAKANTLFEQVPSEIRAKFRNDPGAFIDYATDEKNRDQLVSWGLAVHIPTKSAEPPRKVENAVAKEETAEKIEELITE